MRYVMGRLIIFNESLKILKKDGYSIDEYDDGKSVKNVVWEKLKIRKGERKNFVVVYRLLMIYYLLLEIYDWLDVIVYCLDIVVYRLLVVYY